MKHQLTIVRFNLSPRSKLYSKDWEYMETYIDLDTREVVTVMYARLSPETYNIERRVKL